MARWRGAVGLLGLSLLASALAFTVPIKDEDSARQTCSGMWAGPDTAIEVSFDSTSQGQLSMVIYEWRDVMYLGKVTSNEDDSLPKTYVCTSDAVRSGFCNVGELGRFILNLPSNKTINETSFYTARVGFRSEGSTNTTDNASVTPAKDAEVAAPEADNGFWDNPVGNPKIAEEDKKYTSPWRKRDVPGRFRLGKAAAAGNEVSVSRRAESKFDNASPTNLLWYKDAIHYHVHKTGYYCVAVVPVTVLTNNTAGSTDVPFHPTFHGKVEFQNKFKGELPATDYPKVNFYLVMFAVYTILGGIWGFLCFRHKEDILPIQYYLSGLVGFLIVEMIASFVYYRYLNAHGKGTASTVFLFVVAILDAGRNALSFFMLLVVSMGLSVVRETLGGTMIRCQILTGAHFVFGVLYAVGVVELELESTSALILLGFVVPLAFTLSGFLLWILYSLNGTIMELQVRKQTYKLTMFTRLYRILWGTVFCIAVFFVVSSFAFTERLAEDYAANSWQYRWWLLDGGLALLYLFAFWSIAYIWRPSSNNRYLAMSDELAQDEDAEDYDMANLEQGGGRPRGPAHPDDDDDDEDAATLVGGRAGHGSRVRDDQVVFEIGDEDGDEEDDERKQRMRRLSGEHHEREGLIGGDGRKDD